MKTRILGLLVVLFAMITPNNVVMGQKEELSFDLFGENRVPLTIQGRFLPAITTGLSWISVTTEYYFPCQVNFTYDTKKNKPDTDTNTDFSEEKHERSYTLVGLKYSMTMKAGSQNILRFDDPITKDSLFLELTPVEIPTQVEIGEKLEKSDWMVLKYDAETGEYKDPVTSKIYMIGCDGKTKKGYIPVFVTVIPTVPDPYPRR